MRAEGASSSPDDGEPREVWAGVLPLRTASGDPEPNADTPASVTAPVSLGLAVRRLERSAAGPPGTAR